MKFYQIITMLFSIMYVTTIFGAEETLPCVPEVLCELIEQFREQSVFYKQTAHIKPYRIRNIFFGSYTHVKPPFRLIVIHNEKGIVVFQGSYPILYMNLPYSARRNLKVSEELDFKTFYRTEWRLLSNMEVRKRGFFHEIGTRALPHSSKLKRKNWIYALEAGKVNIYLSETDFKSKDAQISLPTEGNVTAFDVSKDGKKIVTGGTDGIHMFELQEGKQLKQILKELQEQAVEEEKWSAEEEKIRRAIDAFEPPML